MRMLQVAVRGWEIRLFLAGGEKFLERPAVEIGEIL